MEARMNTKCIESIINEIEQHDKIALYRHIYPDQDAYGAQVGLKEIIQMTYPHKKVYLLGEMVEELSYIGQMDDATQLEIDATWLGIIVDVGDAGRIDNQTFKTCGKLIKIDHHKAFEAPFEDVSWVDSTYPATCMMLIDLLIEAKGRLKISKRGREVLYMGVVADTGRFEYLSNPTEVFSKLTTITYDLDVTPLYDALYKECMDEIKFLGYIYTNFEVRKNGVGILKIPADIITKYHLRATEAARRVNALKHVEGLVNWHFFAESPTTGKIHCEFRSKGPCVNEIAMQYGGGGHFLASGAILENWDVVEAMIQVFENNCMENN